MRHLSLPVCPPPQAKICTDTPDACVYFTAFGLYLMRPCSCSIMYFYNLNTRDKNNKEGEDVTEEDNGRSGVNNCYDVIINTTPSTTIITMSGLCLVLC